MTSTTATSRWVLLYLGLMLLVSVNTTALGYLAPHLLFGEAVGDYAGAAPITHFYATRNLAVAVLCGIALLDRSRPLLFAAILMRLMIDSVDLGFTLHHRILDVPSGLVVAAWLLFFTAPQALCLWHLRRSVAGDGWRFQFEEQVHVSTNSARAWAVLTQHEAMPSWVKLGLRWVRLQPDSNGEVGTPGSRRLIRFFGWPQVTERFIEVEAPLRYSYKVVAGMPHLRDHLGVVEVEDHGGRCSIRWTITFVFSPYHPLSWAAPVFVAGFRKVVAQGLEELKRQLESGAEASA